MNARASLIALVLAAAGQGAGAAPPGPLDWKRVATAADRDRIRAWRSTWMTAVAKAGRTNPREVKAEGALLKPDTALPDPAPPVGAYRCRVIKLGAQSKGMLDFVTYPPFRCRVRQEGDVLGFAKLTGSQRPIGLMFADTPNRMVFLGSMMLASERRALDYGADRERDVAGLVERIGPRRWRLVMPSPRWESLLDVVELVPEWSPPARPE